MNKIEKWILSRFGYKRWIKLRESSNDEYNEKLCYCGHTYKCSCDNPDKQLFIESVERGTIILGDKNENSTTRSDRRH